MRYFSIEYEFKTRPMYRKRRWRTATVAIAATDLADSLRAAKEDGERRFGSRKWHVFKTTELTAPNAVSA